MNWLNHLATWQHSKHLLASTVTKRLPYGASVGSEVCHHVIGQVLEGCHNSRNIADDIPVHGTTREEHDRSLGNVLLRLQDKNLTVNPAKCLFGVTEIDHYGFHISRYISRQESYTRSQANATTQHRSKKFSWISKYCGPIRSKSRCYDRAYTKNHAQKPSMVVGSGATWSL